MGLPRAEIPVALLLFNLGVEAGQMLFVLLIVLLARAFRILEMRWPRWVEAYGRAGQPQAGLQVLAEAVTLMTTTELWWSEAEMSRLQGALRLQLPSPEVPQAEASLQQALEVARRQEAKALELRAAMSLARLWQQQDQRHAARELLAPIYGWFTEGFDTADLQEAKALLEELA